MKIPSSSSFSYYFSHPLRSEVYMSEFDKNHNGKEEDEHNTEMEHWADVMRTMLLYSDFVNINIR
jgi:hypothetical protein